MGINLDIKIFYDQIIQEHLNLNSNSFLYICSVKLSTKRKMKPLYFIFVVVILTNCQKTEVTTVYTGNQATYGLVQTSQYPVSGTVTFKERKDSSTTISVQLKGTNGTERLPVHLHLGDMASNNATVAALLSPANAASGESETVISHLADEKKVTYRNLLKLSAYINVHASNSGPQSKVILAAGNIGVSGTKSSSARIGNCGGK